MRTSIQLAVVVVFLSFVATASALAESKVTISGVHLCCPQCVSAVKKTLDGIDGVKHESNQGAKTITITAPGDDAAQKAIDALAAAGFYGKLDSKTVKYKDVATPDGKVKRLEVSEVHNCCGACTTAIKGVLGKVDGVTANTVKAKESSFVVEGDFSADALVKAMLDAGFYVKVKK